MAKKYSIWQAAEDIVNADFCWIIEGPWNDAEDYEDTLDQALEHLQSCCEAMVITNYNETVKYDDDEEEEEDIEWLECRDDVGLLETLLEQMNEDHKWYNELHELLFMNTLAGA